VRRGNVFVVSGPSGVGKSTIVRAVLEQDRQVQFSISHTTRPQRPGEVDGVDYYFVDNDKFLRLFQQGFFLENAVYQGNHYGTSQAAVDGPTSKGLDLILEVETQGAELLRSRLPAATSIFIVPPTPSVLEERLRKRNTESDYVLQGRLQRALEELEEAKHYDHRIVNDTVEKAVEQLLRIIRDKREVTG